MIVVQLEKDVHLLGDAVCRTTPLSSLHDCDIERYALVLLALYDIVQLLLRIVQSEPNLSALLGYDWEAEVRPEVIVIFVAYSP